MISVTPAQLLKPLKPTLVKWFEQTGAENWLRLVAELPISNRVFLEFHPASAVERCDVITRLMFSDGSLDHWLDRPTREESSAWRKSLQMLEAWRSQVQSGRGALQRAIFLMWLEFDLKSSSDTIGDPALGIGLTPFPDLAALADDLGDYKDLQQALRGFLRLAGPGSKLDGEILRGDPLVLGHLGYMASRGNGDHGVLPLRSCWRCEDLDHVFRILHHAGIPHDIDLLASELRSFTGWEVKANSIMLHLDSGPLFARDFSLEVNVFTPNVVRAKPKERDLFQYMVRRGFLEGAQRDILSTLTARHVLPRGQITSCSLHHIKLALKKSKVTDVKFYWLSRSSATG
jgi:hypothetical protein